MGFRYRGRVAADSGLCRWRSTYAYSQEGGLLIMPMLCCLMAPFTAKKKQREIPAGMLPPKRLRCLPAFVGFRLATLILHRKCETSAVHVAAKQTGHHRMCCTRPVLPFSLKRPRRGSTGLLQACRSTTTGSGTNRDDMCLSRAPITNSCIGTKEYGHQHCIEPIVFSKRLPALPLCFARQCLKCVVFS